MHEIGLLQAIHSIGSQAKLARVLHVPKSTLNDWLNCNAKIPYHHALAIAEATNWQVQLDLLAPYATRQNKLIKKLLFATKILTS